jgi:hypothetical protein
MSRNQHQQTGLQRIDLYGLLRLLRIEVVPRRHLNEPLSLNGRKVWIYESLVIVATPRVSHTTYNDIADTARYDQQQLELDREWCITCISFN